jgi:regulator of protease activity HflC (stomatin/prohibitin superfamily)
MDTQSLVGIALVAVVVLVIIGIFVLASYRKEFLVFQYQRGVLFNEGKLERVLEGGRHKVFGRGWTIQMVDVRPTTTAIGNQEILTKDGLSVKITATARYQVADAAKAVLESQAYITEAYLAVQIAMRDAVTDLTADEVLAQRESIATRVTEASKARFDQVGLALEEVQLRDITFPGELKKAMAQVALAQKEGLASLERARSESAALRSLANAARLLEGNPALMQLRILQSLGDAKGATIVLNTTDLSVLPAAPTLDA